MGHIIPPRTKRTQRDYTLAFKLAVDSLVEKGEFTCKKAQDRYGIQGKSTPVVRTALVAKRSISVWEERCVAGIRLRGETPE